MLAKQTRLIMIITKELEKHKSFVEKHKTALTISVLNEKLLETLKYDKTTIADETEETLNNIIESFDINPVEKIILKNNIGIIKNIIQMNKDEGTTIELEENQKQSLETFIKYLEESNNKKEVSLPLEEPEYENSISKISELTEILEQLNNGYNNKIIT